MENVIREIGIHENETWNKIVKSFSNYEPFYLNEYALAFMNENENNGIPVLLYFENEKNRAINVVFKRDVEKDERFKGLIEPDTFYDLISPYGYGGFYGEINDYNEINEEYNKYCVEKHYICEFVRFLLFGNYSKYYDGNTRLCLHNVVCNLTESLENIWMNFKPKVRRNVRRAEKSGLKFIIDPKGERVDDFLNIYYSTMAFNSANKEYYFSKSFFETLKQLNENIVFFFAQYMDTIISAEIVLIGANNCYFYLGGSNREYSQFRANEFLKYNIIRWAKENSLDSYILGGGYGQDDDLFRYKEGFSPNGICNFYVGSKIFDNSAYRFLVDIRQNQTPFEHPNTFFPLYRY